MMTRPSGTGSGSRARLRPPVALPLLGAALLLLGCAALARPAYAAVCRAAPEASGVLAPDASGVLALDLLRLEPALTYPQWMQREGWEDRRPFSYSAKRFRIEDGVLRLESAGDSFLIGKLLGGTASAPPPAIAQRPYLRFVVRIAQAAQGAQLAGEAADDSPFRIYATFSDSPPQALVYVWSWALPVGEWSVRGRSFWGDFRGIHRKAFGQGDPPPGWITVEVDLARDYRLRFPGAPLPRLAGLALKADSNNTAGQRTLAFLRSASLHATSLRGAGCRDGDTLGAGNAATVLWFR